MCTEQEIERILYTICRIDDRLKVITELLEVELLIIMTVASTSIAPTMCLCSKLFSPHNNL